MEGEWDQTRFEPCVSTRSGCDQEPEFAAAAEMRWSWQAKEQTRAIEKVQSLVRVDGARREMMRVDPEVAAAVVEGGC